LDPISENGERDAGVSRAISGRLFGIAVLAFVSLGLPDGTLGVAWPSIKDTFGLPISSLGVLLSAGAVGYLISSSQSGHLLARLGVGRLLFWSTVLTASAALVYAFSPAWPALVVFATVGGLGAGAIDAGTNAYAASNFSPARVTWLHASYGIGAAAGPMLMSWVLERRYPWQTGYMGIGAALAAMAVLFWFSRPLWSNGRDAPVAPEKAAETFRIRDALARRSVWFGVSLFFLYAGLESTVGQWAFSLLTIAREWDEQTAGFAVSVYWCSLTAGRILFGIAAHRFSATAIIRFGMLLAPPAALMLMATDHTIAAFLGLGLIGFAFAPVFPCMIVETPSRVGDPLAHHAIGLQVSAAYLGMAAIPSLIGVLARFEGLEVMGPFLLIGAIMLLVLHEASVRSARTIPATQ